MIKVGLIGAGFMGGTHVACYQELLKTLGFKVTAVADLDRERAEKAAQKFGAKVFLSGDELIENGDVNMVDICLPTYLHAPHALKAMEKGYDVFVEKPVCISEKEAAELEAMQKKTGVRVAVGQCLRFWDEYVYLKKIVEEKAYGSLVSAVFKRLSPKPMWGWNQWLHDPGKSGLAALDLHIHDVDFVRYLLGEPDTIEASMTDGGEHIFATYRYGKMPVSLEGGWDFPSSYPFEMAYRVRFDKAVVVFSSLASPSVTVYQEDGVVDQPKIQGDFSADSDELGGNISSLGGYFNELRYFLECLVHNRPVQVAPLEEGTASFRLVMREIRAAE